MERLHAARRRAPFCSTPYEGAGAGSKAEGGRLDFEFDADGAMVGAHDFGLDKRAPDSGHEILGDEDVVDAPADVPRAAVAPGVPVGVGVALFGVEGAEGVDVAAFDDAGDPGAFLGEEPGALEGLLGAGDVELGVGDVEVAHEDEGAALAAEVVEMGEEGFVELEFVGEAILATAGIWVVGCEQGELRVVGLDDAPFDVEAFDAEPETDFERLGFREQERSAVAGALGWMPPGSVAEGIPGLVVDLLGDGLDFLEPGDVGACFLEPGLEMAPFEGGAKAVDVPRADGEQGHGGS